ncbi:caib baif family enzyme [Fusarium sp. NRRL 52700]|nr:caib baif family enzyme [Fusarium sp. NRRL 52700]
MAPEYTIEQGAKQLLATLFDDPRLQIAPEVEAEIKKVQFSGHKTPWLPVPFKFSEGAGALTALMAGGAALIAKERYGIEQQVVSNTDKASLNLFGFFFPKVDGEFILKSSPAVVEASKEADPYEMLKPIHWSGVGHYKTKDGRYYHVQTAWKPHPVMKALGIEEQDVTPREGYKIYQDKVIQWDSEALDRLMNDELRHSGTICWTPEEFYNETEHGKVVNKEPAAFVTKLEAPRKAWPTPAKDGTFRPLEGIRVLDASRAIAAPIISKMLAALGADVIHVSCLEIPDIPQCMVDAQNGKRDVAINLRTDEGKQQFKHLLKDADVFVDGFRPNALEKLGFSAAACREDNPSLIYVRENCYGYNGPWAYRAGWQTLADAVTGICMVMGRWLGLGDEPVQPIGHGRVANADYSTGMLGAGLIVNLLWQRAHADVTFDLKLSLVHYDTWLYKFGQYDKVQQDALRDLHKDFTTNFNDSFLFEAQANAWKSINTIRPGLSDRPEFYSTLPGKLWGEERDMQVVAPPFEFSKSEIGYRYPSGRRGWCKDYNWLPHQAA